MHKELNRMQEASPICTRNQATIACQFGHFLRCVVAVSAEVDLLSETRSRPKSQRAMREGRKGERIAPMLSGLKSLILIYATCPLHRCPRQRRLDASFVQPHRAWDGM